MNKKNMNKNKFKLSSILTAALITGIAGCGGDGDGNGDGSDYTYTGYFIDSPVSGINYVVIDEDNDVETFSGVTGSDGSFSHKFSPGSDEVITFSIGGITFPPIDVVETVTPFTLAGSASIDSPSVINMIQLLMSLDSDGDPSNGISITEATHTAAASLTTLDFSSVDFDTEVANLVADSGSTNTTLVTEDAAKTHFNTTLSALTAENANADIKAILDYSHWTNGCFPDDDTSNNFEASTSFVNFDANGTFNSNGIEWEDANCTVSNGNYNVTTAWTLGDVVTAPDGYPAVTMNFIGGDITGSFLVRVVSGYLYTAGGESGDDFSEAEVFYPN